MQQKIKKYLQLAKQHLLLPAANLLLPSAKLSLPAPIRKLSGWPILPWLGLVAIVLALLFLPLSCARQAPAVDAPEISRTVPGYVGEFKLLANSQPTGSQLLEAFKLSDGRLLIIYDDGTWVRFDPTTNSFSELSVRVQLAGHTLQLINDSTLLAYDPNGTSRWIVDIDSGETKLFGNDLVGISRAFSVADNRVLAFGYRKAIANKFITKLVYDLTTGEEVLTDDPAPNEQPPTGPRSFYTTTYNLDERTMLVFDSSISVLDTTTLKFDPVAVGIQGGQVPPLRLDNGLLLLVPNSFGLSEAEFDLPTLAGLGPRNTETYLFHPSTRQLVPFNFAYGFQLKNHYVSGFANATAESLRALFATYFGPQKQVAVLADGTILLTSNNSQTIATDAFVIDLNNYQIIKDVDPPSTTTHLVNPLVPNGAMFATNLTLDDGRVIFLGLQNVIYTPDSRRTPEQRAIDARKAQLPDWPSTNWRDSGVWNLLGELANMDELNLREHANTAEFIMERLKGTARLAHNQVLFYFQRGINLSVIGQLFNLATRQASVIDSSEANHNQYDPIIDASNPLAARHIVETAAGKFRIGGPDAPALVSETKLRAYTQPERDAVVGVADVERWDGQAWVSLNQMAVDKLVARYERQGKTVRVYDSRTMSGRERANWPSIMAAATAKDRNLVYVDKNEQGGRLVVNRDAAFSVTALPDGRILIVGGTADLSALPWITELPDGRAQLNWVTGTVTGPGGIQLGNASGTKVGKTRSVEIYDPRTNVSEEVVQLTLARSGHHTVVLPGNQVAVIGGEGNLMVENARGDYVYATEPLGYQTTYEIVNLLTGQTTLYENVLMFRHSWASPVAVMPNGHIYIGDAAVPNDRWSRYGSEVLDWHNHISYPASQTNFGGVNIPASLGDGRVVTVAATTPHQDELAVMVFQPVTGGARVLPRALNWVSGEAWDLPVLRYFLWTQLTILLIGMPLIYLLVGTTRRRRIRRRLNK